MTKKHIKRKGEENEGETDGSKLNREREMKREDRRE